MGFNKIPLALKFNDSTGNAEGLIEFTLNVSDIGDICEDGYSPSPGDVLTYDAGSDCWTPSASPAVAAGALSALTDICAGVTSVNQYEALVWDGNQWCPSSLVFTAAGGGGIPDPGSANASDVLAYNNSEWVAASRAELNLPILNAVNTFSQTNNFSTGLNATGPLIVNNNATFRTNGAIQLDDGITADTVLNNQGEFCFDSETETIALNLGRDTIIHMGEDQVIQTRNQTGATISSGVAVYVSGVESGKLAITLAGSDISQDDQRILGVTRTETAGTGGTDRIGFIQTFGKMNLNVTTKVGGTPSVGQPIYVGTAGQLTVTKPTEGSVIRVGKVEVLGADGQIFIDVQHGFVANDLDDVNVDVNSVVITDGTASAVSSLSGVSGSMVYFSGTDPAPYLTNIEDILSHEGYTIQEGETYLTGVAPANLNLDAGEALYNNGGTLDGFTTQANGRAFVNSTAKVSDLSDISETTSLSDGNLMQYQGTAWNFVTFAEAQNYENALESGSQLDHGILSGLGDDDHTQYVLADGTRAITGDLSSVGVSATSGEIATTPTAANHIANKSYVDSQIPTPSYFQALASGSITGVADEALTILGWATSGTYALSDPDGNLVLDGGDTPDLSVINVSGNGVYQIDATVRISNNTERVGIVFRIYLDTGSGFTDIPELRSSNYASRGGGSGEGITNGNCHLNTILSLNAGDRLQFRAQPKTAGATSTIQQEGTYVRIVKIA